MLILRQILSAVFAYPTHKLRIRPSSQKQDSTHSGITEEAFLRSLFLSSSQAQHPSNAPTPYIPSQAGYSSQDEASLTTHAFRDNSSRKHKRHRSSASKSSPKMRSKVLYARTSSFTSDLGASMLDPEVRPGSQPNASAYGFGSVAPSLQGDSSVNTIADDRQNHRPDSVLTGRSSAAVTVPTFTGSMRSGFSAPLPLPSKPMHIHTDPTPIINYRRLAADSVFAEADNPTLPKGLVISGLEFASNLVQRAFINVLTEKRVVLESGEEVDDRLGDGVWSLPQDFFVVYVCVHDPYERPNIHKTLLDKFAMSASINLSPATRQAIRAHRSSAYNSQSLAHSMPSLAASTGPTIHAPRPMYPSSSVFAQSTTPTTTPNPLRQRNSPILSPTSYPPQLPLLPDSLLPTLREIYANRTQISPRLLLYASDLFSAARHHPELEGLLLTARAHRDASELARASRVLGMDLTGAEVIRELEPLPDDSVPEYRFEARSSTGGGTMDGDVYTIGGGMSDIHSGIGSGIGLLSPFSDGRSGNGQVHVGLVDDRSVSEAQSSQYGAPEPDQHAALDVSDADIMRIVPRVLTHRLRVRDALEDQVLGSLVCCAVSKTANLPSRSEMQASASIQKEKEGISGQDKPGEEWWRSTVKDILIQLLAEV
ncbi:hypothetical protein HGRIS_002767 [Hohenbuehelia grisea]|uniref:Uncharacterized protein n=1 Tax=Hohenbuehelia grisea TaxID=104357 RepID=A0ABR3JMV6_9AGAR